MDINLAISVVVILAILFLVYSSKISSKKVEKFADTNFSEDIKIQKTDEDTTMIYYKEGETIDFNKITDIKKIIFGVYGSDKRVNLVTTKLKNAYNDWIANPKKNTFKVSNDNLSGDPDQGSKKYLRVWYNPIEPSPAPTFV